MAQSIKKNSIFNAIKTLSSIIFPLTTFPYISRVLLPENVGKINFALSIVSYFSLIASLGITTYAIRECSAVREDKEKLANTASQIFSINLITTGIAYFALAITLIFYSKLENYRLLITVQSFSIVATTLGADWLNSAMEDFKYITLRTVFFQFVSLILMFTFVHYPEDYMKYVFISLISSAGASMTNIWYRRRYCKVRVIKNVRQGIEWKRHMMSIVFLFVMILAQNIFNNVDSTMLGLIHGDYEVGIYSTAHKISYLITQVIVSIAWVVMPRMSYYFEEQNYEKINELSGKVFGLFCIVGLPFVTGTVMLSKEIVFIIAGNLYSDSAVVLQILMIGFVFNLFGNSFLGNIILLPSKKEKLFMITCCVASMFNIILNYWLIPQYGSVAAGFTTVICYFISMIILLLTKDKRIQIKGIRSFLLSPSIGCVGMIPVFLLFDGISGLWLKTILKIFVSVCIYILIQYVMKNQIFIELVNSIRQILTKI